MIKVSVIVPVYNPGSHIDDCIASVLGQTLPAAEYEAIFVDDGSTDGTAERLDRLAAEHPQVRVRHIESSGWAGRPRNVGIEMARGEYVYFVDNDDWIAPDALEALWTTAQRDEADVVVGKVVGHGKFVPATLFAANRSRVSLHDGPLLGLLSPHKLFRRAFVEEHGLRFPEGRRRLEDHVFVLGAYFATDRVSILADRPCYHWMRRSGANASYEAWDPAAYYADVRDVLDVIERNTEPGPQRDRLLVHYFRGKALARVSGRRAPQHSARWRREVFDEVRALTLERFGEHLDALLPFNQRQRARLLRAGDRDGMERLAALERALSAEATLAGPQPPARGEIALRVTARMAGGLRFARDGETLRWEGQDATEAVQSSRLTVAVRSLADRSEFPLTVTSEVRLADGPDGTCEVLVDAVVRLDPATAAAGSPLAPGDHDLPVLLYVAGFAATGVLRRSRAAPPLAIRVDAQGRGRVRTTSTRAVGLALARRMPRLARAAKRAARRAGRR